MRQNSNLAISYSAPASASASGLDATWPISELRRETIAGMVNARRRPGSATGVIFMTIEDEIGDPNIVLWEKAGKDYKQPVYGSSLVLITGFVQWEGRGTPHRSDGGRSLPHVGDDR